MFGEGVFPRVSLDLPRCTEQDEAGVESERDGDEPVGFAALEAAARNSLTRQRQQNTFRSSSAASSRGDQDQQPDGHVEVSSPKNWTNTPASWHCITKGILERLVSRDEKTSSLSLVRFSRTVRPRRRWSRRWSDSQWGNGQLRSSAAPERRRRRPTYSPCTTTRRPGPRCPSGAAATAQVAAGSGVGLQNQGQGEKTPESLKVQLPSEPNWAPVCVTMTHMLVYYFRAQLPAYSLDFGHVVLGTVRTHTVRATNSGWFPVSFHVEREGLAALQQVEKVLVIVNSTFYTRRTRSV